MIEMGISAVHFGRTSITLRAEVRNLVTRQSILTIERMVFVAIDEHGKPTPHGRTHVVDDPFEADE